MKNARTALATLALAVPLGLLPAAAYGDGTSPSLPPEDPALSQQIDPDQGYAEDEVVLDQGHVDLGPRFQDGDWTLMVHDDTHVEGSVWRDLDRTVFRVSDAALQQVPDDPTYSFLGVDAGTEVHVVPQTQAEDVIWLGWNTQDPAVLDTVDRGVTLSLTGVDGPGELLVYLQDGGFGEPDVLWDSHVDKPQPLWVDVNTHTHANWVFTRPGVYLVNVEAAADLIDGTSVRHTGTLRVAVGDEVSEDEAMAATAPPTVTPDGVQEPAPGTAATRAGGSSATPYVAAGVAVAVALAALLVLVVARGRSARRRALAQR